jgi:hypothetical protein
MGRGEGDAFLNEPSADAEPACIGLDEQKTKLSDVVGLTHEKHTSDSLSIFFGYPAAFARRIEVADEIRRDLLDEIPKTRIPSVFRGINLTVPPNDPLDVVVAMLAKLKGMAHSKKFAVPDVLTQ